MDPVGTLGGEEIYTFGDVEGITMYENVLRAMKEKFDVEKELLERQKELLERQNKNLREKVIQVEAKNAKLKARNLELEKEKNALQPMWRCRYSPP